MASFIAKQMVGNQLKSVKGALGDDEKKDNGEADDGEDPEVAEARREMEEKRKEKHRKMEAEREDMRQSIRDKYGLKKKVPEEQNMMQQEEAGRIGRKKKTPAELAAEANADSDDDDFAITRQVDLHGLFGVSKVQAEFQSVGVSKVQAEIQSVGVSKVQTEFQSVESIVSHPCLGIFLLAVVQVYFGHEVFCKPVAVSCPKLSNSDQAHLERKLAEEGQGLHWSFYLVPQMKQNSEDNLEHFDLGSVDPKYTYLYGKSGKKCPKMRTTNPFINLHDDCPVHYVMQHDKNRVPQNVVHARCNCKKCLNVASPGMACKPVYTYTKVFRRSADCKTFERVLEAIPVACTCSSIDQLIVVNDQESSDDRRPKMAQ